MKDFINTTIVGTVGVWREGDIIRHTLDNLLSWCKFICVVLDFPDEKTKGIVEEYRKAHPHIFRVSTTSSVPDLIHPENIKRRAKVYASLIVEEKLKLVRELNKEHPIDILLTPDSDEIFVDHFLELLNDFWDSGKSSFCTSYIDVFDTMNLIHTKGLQAHWRGYRYSPELNFTPRRYRDFYNPIKYEDTFHMSRGIVHLSQLRENWENRRKLRESPLYELSPNAGLWKTDKRADLLTEEERKNIILKKPDYTFASYHEKFPS